MRASQTVDREQADVVDVTGADNFSVRLFFDKKNHLPLLRDPSGALINKAQVQLLRNGQLHATPQTNQRGEARFNKVAPGRDQVHIEAVGFKAQDAWNSACA